ncbi:MAG: hypothetical protein A2X32_10225 [Elusimicrobia bacterium GWC2_64_44]|nr:MAG: hypothetical protein A2X32_10225 [Elusimicrobia bacterium GWC2_64_44]
MKKMTFLMILAAFPAALAAQDTAFTQLGAASAARTAEFTPALAPAAPAAEARGTQLLLDPATGRVIVVIPVGGGFIRASDGKFVAAVYTGSGYLTGAGQFFPAVGGARAAARRAPGPVKTSGGLSGKWTGWGEWTYQGAGTRCDMMTLTFEDAPGYLDRRGGYFDCGFVALESLPARFSKRGTDLLDETGAVAGSYADGLIRLNEAYSETVDIFTAIKVDGLHFDYTETWKEKDGKEIYVIRGRLFTGSHDLP